MFGWFKRRQHRLPKFPSGVEPTFWAICETLDEKGIAELKAALIAYQQEMHDRSVVHRTVDLHKLEALTNACVYLLERYSEFPPEQQALIVGAVRYVAVTEDPWDETVFASGLHDDRCVVNYVLEELGITDRYLDTR